MKNKTLDAAVAQDLIERALESIGGKSVVKEAQPVLAAFLEVARESSHVAGERSLSIKGISVTRGDEVVFQIVASGPDRKPVAGKEKRIPIAYGGDGYTCVLVSKGPPPTYVCLYW